MLFYLSGYYLLGMGAWLIGLAIALAWGLSLRRRWKGHPGRLRWIHGGLSLWFVLAALTVPELWYALFVDRTDSFNSTNVSERWFRRHVRLNPQGFRDSEPFSRMLPENQKRIVFLGDSFTFGHGLKHVEDRFSDQVGRALEAAVPGKYQVANISAPGLAVNDMPQLWKRKVVREDCRVDLVVYAICLNDIEWMAGEEANAEYEPLRQMKPQFFLFRDTYFYNWLYYRVQMLRLPKLHNYYEYVHQYYSGKPWQKMERELNKLQTLLREQGTELRFVIFPFLHNLGPDYPFRDCHQQLLKYAAEHQIRAIDLEPILSQHISEGLTINPYDAHPSIRAHTLAAEAILRELLPDLIQPLDQNPRKL